MGDFVAPSTDAERRIDAHINVLVTGFGPFRHTTLNPSWETAKRLSKQGIEASDKTRHIKIDAAFIPTEYDAVIAALSYFHGLSREEPDLPDDMVQDADIAARSDFDPEKYYDLVLHIGQGRSGGIQIETIAHQLGYRLLDAKGQLAPIVDGEEEATDLTFQAPEQAMNSEERTAGLNRGYPVPDELKDCLLQDLHLETTIDTQDLADALSKAYPLHRIKKSTNAGRYICEFTYFGSLLGVIARHRSDESKGMHGRRTRITESTKVLFVHVPPENDPLSIQDMTDVIRSAIEEIASAV